MAFRDLVIFAFVFGSLPFVLARPYLGIVVWNVLAFLNPHRFGFATYDFRFSLIVGVTLIVATLISRDRGRMVWTPVTYWWILFFCWTGLTTLFALEPDVAVGAWSRWWKINLVCLIAMWLMQSRERLNLLIWTIVGSLGFYGVKGGLFTILSGGTLHVYGPPDSFLEENNGMGLALIMTVPLMRYLQLEAKQRWLRIALGGSMLITAFAILGSQSRGAFLGLIAMAGFLVLKSPNRWKAILPVIVLAPLLFVFMPSSWHERMGTLQTYDQDASAMGRINAWSFAFRLAQDRPLVGGGFDTFTERLFQIYAPNPTDVHDAHSIYFEVLGEQGFVGLAFFLSLGVAVVMSCRRIAALTENRPELRWARNLGAMAQVSLLGYAVSGAFLGLAYFDLPWNLVLIVVLTRVLVERAVAVATSEEGVRARGPGPAVRHAGGTLGSTARSGPIART